MDETIRLLTEIADHLDDDPDEANETVMDRLKTIQGTVVALHLSVVP